MRYVIMSSTETALERRLKAARVLRRLGGLESGFCSGSCTSCKPNGYRHMAANDTKDFDSAPYGLGSLVSIPTPTAASFRLFQPNSYKVASWRGFIQFQKRRWLGEIGHTRASARAPQFPQSKNIAKHHTTRLKTRKRCYLIYCTCTEYGGK
jgi:hypothetical protein